MRHSDDGPLAWNEYREALSFVRANFLQFWKSLNCPSLLASCKLASCKDDSTVSKEMSLTKEWCDYLITVGGGDEKQVFLMAGKGLCSKCIILPLGGFQKNELRLVWREKMKRYYVYH